MRFWWIGRRTALLLLCAVLFAFALSPAYASSEPEEEVTRTVRVAYPIQPGLTEVDETGEYRGYTYEYLQEIAQYTGWDYEFVEMDGKEDDTLSALLEMVRTGEADLMGGMLYSEEMGAAFTYAGQSYGTVETVLQTSPENLGSVWINSQVEQVMRIAVVSTTGRTIQELENYCRMNLVEPDYVLCADEEEQVEAVKQGRADALLNTSLNYLEGMLTIARFSPKPFYFITCKNNGEGLADELDKALLSIAQSNPYFSTELFEKYFAPQDNTLRLTHEEREYIAGTQTIRVGYLPEQPPFQWKDERRLRGITVDLMASLSEKTGLQFQMIEADSIDELFARAGAGELDLIAGVPYDYSFAQERHIAMTRPYLSAQYMLIMNEKTGRTGREGKRLAMPATSSYHGYTIGNVVWFGSSSACVEAVNRGEADYTYVDSCTAQYYINQPDYWGLRMAPVNYEPLECCFGVPKPVDAKLLTILNKAVRSITVEEIQAAIIDNTFPAERLSLGGFMRAHPVESVALVSSVLCLIIVLLVLLLHQRARNTREAALELKKRLRVYTLANDYFFEYDHRDRSLVVSVPAPDLPDKVDMRRYQCPEEGEMQQEEDASSFWRMIRTRRDGVRELQQRCDDGQWHWLRVALETIYDKEGNPAYAVGKLNIIDAEREEKVELETQAQLDGLTGLYNAKTSQEKIGELLAQMREEDAGAFLLMDVDKFKSINDTYGHAQGNTVLRRLAGILRQLTRSQDVVGRFGGDEFLVYFAGVRDETILEQRYAALREKIEAECASGEIPRFTVSIGVTFSARGMDYNMLLQAADSALYAAKAQGRDCFAVADGPQRPSGG